MTRLAALGGRGDGTGPEDFGGTDDGSHWTAQRDAEDKYRTTRDGMVIGPFPGGGDDPWATLRGLCKSEGFELTIDDCAPDRLDRLGEPQRDELCAQACQNNVIAVRSTLRPEFAFYAVSHEIAETRSGFTGHHQLLWREQCTVLARWCRRLGAGKP